jgi:hypothetical protein
MGNVIFTRRFSPEDWEPITATGGNNIFEINDDGIDYRVHAFTSGTQTFSVQSLGTDGLLDVLVVAGGGGGATTGSDSAGGGAGGLIFRPKIEIAQTNYSISIGNGGGANSNGGNSAAFGLTTIGGGHGSTSQTNGIAGGSGGGAGRNQGVGGAGTQPNQSGNSGAFGFGNRGGTNTGHIGTEGMGGGGAGQAGIDAINIDANIKTGGDGLFQVTPQLRSIYTRTYNFAQSFGTSYGQIINGQAWFAGGGGGGGERGTPTQNLGGRGGGGRGGHLNGPSRNGFPGQANTGGGGGGSDNQTAGSGGSGIVLIRYPLKKPVN